METEKNRRISLDEINEYLSRVRYCITNGRYKISDRNRIENVNFINTYSLTQKKIIKMLQSIDYSNFEYSTRNNHENRNEEILYIFKKNFELDYYGKRKRVEVYIKINMILRNCQDFCFIVSFHE